MNLAAYNNFCASLPATTYVQQWGGAHVWKVGGKVFAISGWSNRVDLVEPYITFKCTELSYDILKDQQGMRPAPYLASRGMKWIQIMDHSVIGDDGVKAYICQSYKMIANKLPKRLKAELGIELRP